MLNSCTKLKVIGRLFFFAAFFLNKINIKNNEGKAAHISPESSSVLCRERCKDQVIKALLERICVRGLEKDSRAQSLITDVQTSEEILGNTVLLEQQEQPQFYSIQTYLMPTDPLSAIAYFIL